MSANLSTGILSFITAHYTTIVKTIAAAFNAAIWNSNSTAIFSAIVLTIV
jgi:hypothetical protein